MILTEAGAKLMLDPRKGHRDIPVKEAGYSYNERAVPSIDMDELQFWGTINTATVDLDGEVVLPEGMDPSYFPEQHRAVYLNHNYSERPIGKCRSIHATRAGIKALTALARTPEGYAIATMINEGVIRGLSIGFRRLDCGSPTPEEGKKYAGVQYMTRTWKAIEYSVTAMPCNPDAEIATKSRDAYLSGLDRLAGKSIPLDIAYKFGLPPPRSKRVALLGSDGSVVAVQG